MYFTEHAPVTLQARYVEGAKRLSIIDFNLACPPGFFLKPVSESLHTQNIAVLVDPFTESVIIRYPQTNSASHHRIEDVTGHHRLIKYPELCPVDVKGPQSSEKIEMASVRLVDNVSTVVLVILYCFGTDPMKGNRVVCKGKLQMVLLTRRHKVLQFCTLPHCRLLPIHPTTVELSENF